MFKLVIIYLFYNLKYIISQNTSENHNVTKLPHTTHQNVKSPYIIAECTAGLSNRLRILAAYMYIGEINYNHSHLVFIWDVNYACPGHFLQLFQSISTVIFATNSSRYVLDKHAQVIYENSYAVFDWTMRMNGIPKSRYGHPTWQQIEYQMYSRFIPRVEILKKVYDYVEKYNICNSYAMHIRITDLEIHLKRKRKSISIQSYYEFVDSLFQNESVFLLTDNPDTQQMFLNKYGSQKILIYSTVHNSSDSLISRTKEIPEDYRFTTLEHTLIDVLIAAHAKSFRPSLFSSLSDLVHLFHKIGRNEYNWCKY